MSKTEPPSLIGALLRVPSQAIHRRLIAELNAAGFIELRLPHIAVFSYPDPDGSRPSDLAERAGISKQAMNQLLQSLEQLGYLRRTPDERDARARIVRLTERGRAVWDEEYRILLDIEREWRAALGDTAFAQLKRLLQKAWVADPIG
jgi:DNA-binding MarR family transcriptional regulator